MFAERLQNLRATSSNSVIELGAKWHESAHSDVLGRVFYMVI